jgi:GntR family transcriptional regulator, transcriptional repressor for pyruvate dehydrogenase complex
MSDQFSEQHPIGESPYLNPIHRTLVVDEVIDRLIALVVNENLKPGDRLPAERELMSRLAIGRSSLREAVKTLSAIGVLEVKRGSGIFVGRGDASILARPLAWGMFLSKDSVGQAIEARSVIESALAGWAAERRSAEDIAALSDILEKLERNQDDQAAYIDLDIQFHLAIASAAQNQILFQVLTIFQHLLRVWMETTYTESHGAADSMASHRQLFGAIRDQDAAAARNIMQLHTSGAPLRSAVMRHFAASDITPDLLSILKKGNG